MDVQATAQRDEAAASACSRRDPAAMAYRRRGPATGMASERRSGEQAEHGTDRPPRKYLRTSWNETIAPSHG
jgi:hypothetical protein